MERQISERLTIDGPDAAGDIMLMITGSDRFEEDVYHYLTSDQAERLLETLEIMLMERAGEL